MSWEAYLCVSPYEGVYPSRHHADFKAEEHVLASATDATPLLWLAMFRPHDLRDVTADVRSTGDPRHSRITAPVTSRQRALANLYASVPVLDRLFRDSVSEHAELLREAMRWLPGVVVTIEWWTDDEPPSAAPTDLDKVLAAFDSDPAASTDELDALTYVTDLRMDEPLVPARLLLDQSPATAEQHAALSRILGRSHMRMVPWETPF